MVITFFFFVLEELQVSWLYPLCVHELSQDLV